MYQLVCTNDESEPAPQPPELDVHLAPGGSVTCDFGTPVSKDECETSVAYLAYAVHRLPRRTLRNGNSKGKNGECLGGGWGNVPAGCSAQTGGDWAAHFKTGPESEPGC